jgi:hypothetical protein
VSAGLYLRAARRSIASGGLSAAALGRLDDRLVFVFGSPRSGTTFLAGAIGGLPGFVDLGEVHPLKAAIPKLAALDAEEGGARIRRILGLTRRLGLVGGRRAVEQTPEAAFVLPAVVQAFPDAVLIHAVRDGRDVVSSLLERGWLSRGRGGADDAGGAYGPHARFWVEPGLEREFAEASDARRAAWAWRRYAGSVRESGVAHHEARYERLPHEAEALAGALGVDPEALRQRLAAAHGSSVGRYRRDLAPEQLAEVEDEVGALLAAFGYASS